MSHTTEIKCDLCGKITTYDSGNEAEHKQKTFDLWLYIGFDWQGKDVYNDINIDICEECEPEFRKGLQRLIDYHTGGK